MSDTQTTPTEAPANAPVSDKEFDSYFSTRGGEVEPTQDDEAGSAEAPAERAEAAERPAAEAKQPDKTQADERGEKVPLAVLLEERRQRQATQAEMAALRQQLEELKNPKPAAQQGNIPTLEEDPVGHFKALMERQAEEFKAFREGMQQDQQQRRAQAEHSALIQDFMAKEQAYVSKVPDYMEAAQHLQNSRVGELRAMGWGDDQIRADLAQNVTQLALMARQAGRDPAELTYEIAKTRGYQPKGEKKENNPSIEEEKLLAAERGQKLGQTIQTSGGSSRPGVMTAERLASLSADKFEAWCSAHPEEAEKLMGG